MTTEGTAMYTQTLLTPSSAPIASVTDNPAAPTTVDTATAAAAAAAAAASVANAAASVAPQSADPKIAIPPSSNPIVTAPSAVTTTAAAAAAAAVHPPPPPHPPQMPMAAAAFGQYPPNVMFSTADPTVMDDQPTYVNPKQYARILKRRESRKKQTGTDVTSYTPRKRSYMHESRHKHAMQRRRGPGGRFLSKEEREIKESQAAAQ